MLFRSALLHGIETVPTILLDHLTPTQARAYRLADNKLSDRSTWDDNKLAIQLKELSDLVLDFDIEAIGFEPPVCTEILNPDVVMMKSA